MRCVPKKGDDVVDRHQARARDRPEQPEHDDLPERRDPLPCPQGGEHRGANQDHQHQGPDRDPRPTSRRRIEPRDPNDPPPPPLRDRLNPPNPPDGQISIGARGAKGMQPLVDVDKHGVEPKPLDLEGEPVFDQNAVRGWVVAGGGHT